MISKFTHWHFVFITELIIDFAFLSFHVAFFLVKHLEKELDKSIKNPFSEIYLKMLIWDGY